MRGFTSKIKAWFLALKRWQKIAVVAGVLLVMFAPVGAKQEKNSEANAVPTPAPSLEATLAPSSTPAATPQPTPAATVERCITVSSKKLSNIAVGLTVTGGGTLTNGYSVKSTDYAELYFIAAVIDGPGMGKGVVGIWASNRLEANDGLIFAIDSYAGTFTDWGLGSTTDANITQTDDGAEEAARCAGKP
jgi:hypothetical protein